MSEDSKGDIKLSARRLVVAYHNGWTVVNTGGMDNKINLGDNKKTTSLTVNGHQTTFKLLDN